MRKTRDFFKNPPALSQSPWVYFFIFLAANTFLSSYFPFQLETKLWIGLAGLLLPFGLALALLPSRLTITRVQKEFLPPFPLWAFFLIGCLALFLRFYRLTTLFRWPSYEEAWVNYSAFELSKNWDWNLFYGSGQAPPAYFWGLSLFFKLFGVSLFTLWFFPALISLLTVPMGYAAARQYFSRSLSVCFLLLLASGFWPVFVGRFPILKVLIPFWECLSLFLLGKWLNSAPQNQKRWSLFLGLALGGGFYTNTSWAPIAVVIGFSFLLLCLKRKNGMAPLFIFSVTTLCLFFPLGLNAPRQGYGSYLNDLWAFSNGSTHGDQLGVSLGYIAQLFWGLEDWCHPFHPVWGGLFNSLCASLFFLGLLEILKNHSNPTARWIGLSLILFLAPGVLTNNLEVFRLVPMMVLIFAVSSFGIGRLLSSAGNRKSLGVVLLILIFSTSLDFFHLAIRYEASWNVPVFWRNCTKSLERYRAFQILEKIRAEKGPGLVFSEFVPGFADQSLTLAGYSFNPVENQGLDWNRASWSALLTNANYRPFLLNRFPDGRSFFLSQDMPRSDGGWMLWVMPVTPERVEVLRRWQAASLSLKPFIRRYIAYVHGQSFKPVWDELLAVRPFFEKDPFLESVFWEKVGDTGLKMDFLDHGPSVQAIQQGILKGYPSAHLFYDLGMYDWMDGKRNESRQAFQRARMAPLDLTDSQRFLQEQK